MKAGRELDLLVMEKVIGFEFDPEVPPDKEREVTVTAKAPKFVGRNDPYKLFVGRPALWGVPPYSTDLKAAWEVVEKLINDGYFFTLYFDNRVQNSPHWIVQYDAWGRMSHLRSTEDTPSLAICLAALKVVGVDTSIQETP